MPSVSLHLVLADRILERWAAEPATAPFDPGDPGAVNAFYQGALGPDLGYFPGGYRLLSDLAHRVRSADLTRFLVESARSPLETAFSWGWVAHVLADRSIHPLVGRGVGELVHGDRHRFIDGSEEPAAHVRVETGIDVLYLDRSYLRPSGPMIPVFDLASVSFLQAAYRHIYSVEIEPHLFFVSHMAVVRKACQALAVTRLVGRIQGIGAAPPAMPAMRWLLQRARALVQDALGFESLALAYLNPVPPSGWLAIEVEREVRRFPSQYLAEYETSLTRLVNCDLDSGHAEVPGSPSRISSTILAGLDLPRPGVRRLSRIPGDLVPAAGGK